MTAQFDPKIPIRGILFIESPGTLQWANHPGAKFVVCVAPGLGFFLCENIEDLFVDCVLPTFIGNSLVVTIQDNLTIL